MKRITKPVFRKKKVFKYNKEDPTSFFLRRYENFGQIIKPKDIVLTPSLRVNTLKIKKEELVERLTAKRIKLDEIEWLDSGFYYKSYFSLGATPEYLQGFYFLQEAVSQFAVQALSPKPGELVLDMASAPAGKTTQMAEYMENKGTIIAIERNKLRLKSLKNNISRMGVENCIVLNMDARDVSKLGLKFDRILLDAPCSGNFVIDKDWFRKRDIEGIQKSAKLQRELLRAAFSVLKKDGVLVYSTCSLEPEENELNIDWLMDNFDTKIEVIDSKKGSNGLTTVGKQVLRKEIARTKRFWPNLTDTQGFFVAKVRKTS